MTVEQETFDIASSLRRSLARLNRRLRLQSRASGISATKHSILGQLYRDGPKNPKALALADGVQPQSVTRVLADLEEAGLVLRTQDQSDRRQFQLEITPHGRDLIVQDAQNRALWLAYAIDNQLNLIEKDLLRLSIQLLDKLADAPAVDQNAETTQETGKQYGSADADFTEQGDSLRSRRDSSEDIL
jgi:DNA-binding MarR family transcriptional regulator